MIGPNHAERPISAWKTRIQVEVSRSVLDEDHGGEARIVYDADPAAQPDESRKVQRKAGLPDAGA